MSDLANHRPTWSYEVTTDHVVDTTPPRHPEIPRLGAGYTWTISCSCSTEAVYIAESIQAVAEMWGYHLTDTAYEAGLQRGRVPIAAHDVLDVITAENRTIGDQISAAIGLLIHQPTDAILDHTLASAGWWKFITDALGMPDATVEQYVIEAIGQRLAKHDGTSDQAPTRDALDDAYTDAYTTGMMHAGLDAQQLHAAKAARDRFIGELGQWSRTLIRAAILDELPDGYDVEVDLTPALDRFDTTEFEKKLSTMLRDAADRFEALDAARQSAAMADAQTMRATLNHLADEVGFKHKAHYVRNDPQETPTESEAPTPSVTVHAGDTVVTREMLDKAEPTLTDRIRAALPAERGQWPEASIANLRLYHAGATRAEFLSDGAKVARLPYDIGRVLECLDQLASGHRKAPPSLDQAIWLAWSSSRSDRRAVANQIIDLFGAGSSIGREAGKIGAGADPDARTAALVYTVRLIADHYTDTADRMQWLLDNPNSVADEPPLGEEADLDEITIDASGLIDNDYPVVDPHEDGWLWFVNRALFHRLGYALAWRPLSDRRFRLLGDGTEEWHFTDEMSAGPEAAVRRLLGDDAVDRALNLWATPDDDPALPEEDGDTGPPWEDLLTDDTLALDLVEVTKVGDPWPRYLANTPSGGVTIEVQGPKALAFLESLDPSDIKTTTKPIRNAAGDLVEHGKLTTSVDPTLDYVAKVTPWRPANGGDVLGQLLPADVLERVRSATIEFTDINSVPSMTVELHSLPDDRRAERLSHRFKLVPVDFPDKVRTGLLAMLNPADEVTLDGDEYYIGELRAWTPSIGAHLWEVELCPMHALAENAITVPGSKLERWFEGVIDGRPSFATLREGSSPSSTQNRHVERETEVSDGEEE